jgi:hypothetical protein
LLSAHLPRWRDRKLIVICFVEFNGKPVTLPSRAPSFVGADLTGVIVNGPDFDGADRAEAKSIAPVGLDQAKNFEKAKNRDRLIQK